MRPPPPPPRPVPRPLLRLLVGPLCLIALALGQPCPAAAPASAPASIQGPDLVSNGDFEQAGGSASAPFPGWTFFSWDGAAQAAPDREARPSGGTTVHLHGTAPGKAAIHQRLHLVPGRYRLSALAASWGLRPGRDNLGGRLLLELPGSRPAMVKLPQGDQDWTPVDLVFEVTKETDSTLYCFLYGPGDLWLDEVRLTALAPDDPSPTGVQPAAASREPLRFTPPLVAADLLLAGYCADPEQAARPHCRRLAAADRAALIPPRHPGPRVLAAFDPPRSIGDGAGHVDLTPGKGLPTDWSGYDYLDLQIRNPGARPIDGLVEIRDARTANYWSRVNWYTRFLPGEQRLRIPLQVFVGEKSVIKERRRLALDAITRLFISVNGAGQVQVMDARLTSDPPYRNDFTRLLKLDGGTETSPVMGGFSPLTADLGYRPGRGYGFDPATRIPKGEDRRHPDNLLRDWLSIASGGLRFDLPDGDYGVWLMLEDPGYWEYVQNYDRRAVLAQGTEVYTDRMTAESLLARIFAHQHTEDLPGDDIWTRYIRSRYRPIEFQVRVTDGQLRLDFTAGAAKTFANTLSALLIWPMTEDRQARAFIEELWERLHEQYRNEYAEDREPSPAAAGATVAPAPGPIPELRVFHRHWGQDLKAADRPRPDESVARIEIVLAQGELEPLTLDLYALAGLTLTAAELDLPGLSADPYQVRHKLTRTTDDGARYAMLPRLLDPLTLPLQLPAGQSRRLWFSVTPQANCPAGTHEGTLRLTLGDGRRLSLPVAATVRPWPLPVANQPFGWLGSVPVYTESAFPAALAAKRAADIAPALELVRRHGMTTFTGGIGGVLPTKGASGLAIDFSTLDAVLTQGAPFPFPPHTYGGLAPRGIGFERYQVGDTLHAFGAPYPEVLARVLAATRAHLAGADRLEPIYTVGDEPSGAGIAQSAALADALRAAGARCSVFTSITDAKSPAAALVGRVDQVFLTHHNAWALGQIRAADGQCGTYNLGGRYARGLYQYRLHRLGCRAGYFQFAFNATHVDPYYALDGREDDFAAAFPTDQPGVLIPTQDLARFGEAIDDYRYLQALETAIARGGDHPAATRAARWLDELLNGLEVDHRALTAPPLDDQALDRMRGQAAAFIDELGR